MDWTVFWATVGASGAVSASASFIVQSYFKHHLDKTLHEHQTRFSHLYTERARVIRRLYARVVRVERALQRHIHPADGYQKEFEDRARSAAKEMIEFYVLHQIDLPAELILKLDNFGQAIRDAFNNLEDSENRLTQVDDQIAAQKQAKKIILDKIPDMRRVLEVEFRHLLGGITQ